MVSWHFDEETRDAITELMNIGVGRAAASLSDLIGQRIELTVPFVRICQTEECRAAVFSLNRQPETIISQTFNGPIRGRMSLCFPVASSLSLAQLLSGKSTSAQEELDAESSGILLEVGNIVLNGVMGSFSNAMSANLNYSIPELQSANRRGDRMLQDALHDDDVLIGDVHFRVLRRDIEGTIVIVFAVGSIRSMLDAVLQPLAVCDFAIQSPPNDIGGYAAAKCRE